MGGLADGVYQVADCRLHVVSQVWPWAANRRAAIEAHFAQAQAQNPTYFNGTIHLLRSHSLDNGIFHGSYVRTDFAAFLYWRACGHPVEAGVRDGFGSAIVTCTGGGVLLGRQRPGNVNAGKAYLPGGFIDPRDVNGDGVIDIEAQTARELREETGLGAELCTRRQGFLLSVAGPLVSIGALHETSLDANALEAHVRGNLAAQAEPELADVVCIREVEALSAFDVPAYSAAVVKALLTADGGS